MLASRASLAATDEACRPGLPGATAALVAMVSIALLATLSGGYCARAHAGEGDTLRPFVNASVGYDSNLFRFADDAQALASSIGEPIRSLTYQRYGAGVDLDWKHGRQQVNGRLSGNRTAFSRYGDRLDYTGQDLRAEWRWQLGNRWSGLLSGARERTQSPYTDNFGAILGGNITTDDSYVFQGEYWFHPDWRARMSLSYRERDWEEQSSRNYTRRATTFGLYRQGGTLRNTGIEFHDIVIEFPNRTPPFTILDKRADEQAVRLLATWAPTGKTRLAGFIGYAQRSQANVKNRDYSGAEWRLAATWVPTGKTTVEATLSRDLNVSEAIDANHELVDGINLSAAWQVLPKVRLIGQGGHQRITYDGSSRKDRRYNAGLSASYELWRGGELAAGFRHERRASTVNAREFDSDTVFLSASLTF